MRIFSVFVVLVVLFWGSVAHATDPVVAPEIAPAAETVEQIQAKAAQGDRRAQFTLGVMYATGQGGVAQDVTLSIVWYRKAAAQGDARAQYNLGVTYYYGKGKSQNYGVAFDWFMKAAAQGNAQAQFTLFTMYFKGIGVPQDYIQAYMWASLAAAQGAENAAQIRDGLATVMTPAQLKEGQRLTREWVVTHPRPLTW